MGSANHSVSYRNIPRGQGLFARTETSHACGDGIPAPNGVERPRPEPQAGQDSSHHRDDSGPWPRGDYEVNGTTRGPRPTRPHATRPAGPAAPLGVSVQEDTTMTFTYSITR